MITIKRDGIVECVSGGKRNLPINQWCECNKCGDVHLNTDRKFIKHWKTDVSICPNCGWVLMAREMTMKRQIEMFEEKAA